MALLQVSLGLLGRILGFRRPAPPAIDIEAQRRKMLLWQRDFDGVVTGLADDLTGGRLTVDGWEQAMRSEIRRYHAGAATIAAGGPRNVDSDDFAIALSRASQQEIYLGRWANELRGQEIDGAQARRIAARARLYGGAGNATFEEVAMGALTDERITLPFYPTDRTQCMSNCTCRWSEPEVSGNRVSFYWILRPESVHCETCPERARVFSKGKPLVFVGGVMQDPERLDNPGLYA